MEVEIKLNVKPAIAGGPMVLFTRLSMLTQLAGFPLGGISKYEIRDLYYDTAEGTLAKAGAGLRSRIVNGQPLLTLKINRFHEGALTRREEYEEPLTQEHVDWVMSKIADLVGEGPFSAEAFFKGQPTGVLAPVLEIGTARLARSVGEYAELVMDLVEYPRLSAQPFWDIEVEAKSGKAGERVIREVETALYELAGGDLAPAKMSKLERGLKLQEKVDRK